ncbi:hypothetical protein J6590_022566 [Homalodisca vitripennis]|nr:hypothetical protein J6590_022566 [Homalodisca vitripennis]
MSGHGWSSHLFLLWARTGIENDVGGQLIYEEHNGFKKDFEMSVEDWPIVARVLFPSLADSRGKFPVAP